jgi:hypothetical protein
MKNNNNNNNIKSVVGWAWKIRSFVTGEWELCYYMRPEKRELLLKGKPTRGARAVRIKMMVLEPNKK